MPQFLSQHAMAALTVIAALLGSALAAVRRPFAMRAEGPQEQVLVRFGYGALLFLALALFPLNVASHLLREPFAWIFGAETYDGGVVESLTVAFYCATVAAIVMLLGRRRGEASTPVWRIIFVLALPVLVFLAGEELSWGQHMLGFSTPEAVRATNLQGEANVHNLISPRLYDTIYQALGFGLILAPALALFPAVRGLLGPLGNGTVLAFSWPAAYPLFALTGFLLQHEVFEELAELSLAATLFYFFAAFHAVELRSDVSGIASRQATMTNRVHSPS